MPGMKKPVQMRVRKKAGKPKKTVNFRQLDDGSLMSETRTENPNGPYTPPVELPHKTVNHAAKHLKSVFGGAMPAPAAAPGGDNDADDQAAPPVAAPTA